MGKLRAKVLGAIGVISGALGAIGAAGLCCGPLAPLFAVFGGFSIILTIYGWAFLAVGIVLIAIAVILHYRKPKICKTKVCKK